MKFDYRAKACSRCGRRTEPLLRSAIYVGIAACSTYRTVCLICGSQILSSQFFCRACEPKIGAFVGQVDQPPR